MAHDISITACPRKSSVAEEGLGLASAEFGATFQSRWMTISCFSQRVAAANSIIPSICSLSIILGTKAPHSSDFISLIETDVYLT